MSEEDVREKLEALRNPPIDMSTALDPPPMKRANYLPAPAVFNLNAACKLINDALDDNGFGCIMADDDFDRMFSGISSPYMMHPLWSLFCTSVSTWLRQQTGLPVDFQIQRQTQANEEYSVKAGHMRHPLGLFWRANPADQ